MFRNVFFGQEQFSKSSPGYKMHFKRQPKIVFVLLLEFLEKPWNFILDFKGAWKALEKKNFCWKCLNMMKTPWIFVPMGNSAGMHWSNSGIERRFQNREQISHLVNVFGFLQVLFPCTISKYFVPSGQELWNCYASLFVNYYRVDNKSVNLLFFLTCPPKPPTHA